MIWPPHEFVVLEGCGHSDRHCRTCPFTESASLHQAAPASSTPQIWGPGRTNVLSLQERARLALDGLRAHYRTLTDSMKVVEPHLANLPAAAQAAARDGVRRQFEEKFQPLRLAIDVLEEVAGK